ncbi:MAG: amino acid permease [Gammaproteobacteria bacterium]|nr:amino acid permease [Gammaproteobacteria bacterium]MCW8987946.1 amino acid permease [Gammaproteobacteria bacterium]
MSLPLLIFYGIGTILGAGIYVLIGKVAGEAGSFAPFSFVFASLLAGFSAFSYAELAARFPRSAGEAIYIEEGFGIQKLSLVVGLMIVLVGIVSTATLAHGFIGYLNVFISFSQPVVITVLIISLGLICAWGIGPSVMIASIMTVVEIIGLLIIIYIGRHSFALLPEQLPALTPSFDVSIWAGIVMGSFIAFYAFLGFEDIVNVAEETINPRLNIPLAIIISLVITTIFYVLISVVTILLLSADELSASDAPLSLLYEKTTGQSPVVITLISLVSVINGALIQVIMASRVLYGMSRKQWLPENLGAVNAITHTPVIAIAVVTITVLVFSLLLPLLSLAKITSFITLIIFMLINFALINIKYSKRAHRGFTVPFWVPLTGGVSTLLFILYLIVTLF